MPDRLVNVNRQTSVLVPALTGDPHPNHDAIVAFRRQKIGR